MHDPRIPNFTLCNGLGALVCNLCKVFKACCSVFGAFRIQEADKNNFVLFSIISQGLGVLHFKN